MDALESHVREESFCPLEIREYRGTGSLGPGRQHSSNDPVIRKEAPAPTHSAGVFIFNFASGHQDAWLVIADHAFQRERRSGEDIRATCSVDELEVASIKADAEGSGSIQRTCTQQDLMTVPLSNSLSSRSARKREHTCLRQ